VFIDREGCVHEPKPAMVEAWKDFFRMYPRYRNTFHRVESKDDLVIMLGEAYWSEDQPEDPAIWTATIADDRVREWHIYADTPRNRKRLHLA
jgi:predicted SnoaL-like aldol condensation-catalyzing enzyme